MKIIKIKSMSCPKGAIFEHVQPFQSILVCWQELAGKIRVHWLWRFFWMIILVKLDQSVYLKNGAEWKNHLSVLLTSNFCFWFANITRTLSSFIIWDFWVWHPPLYVTFSIHPSVRLPVAHHILGTVHHLIIIFGIHV